MIKITVELFPLGFEKLRTTIGVLEIRNDATGTETVGNYTYKISKARKPEQTWKEGRITGFRRRQFSVWYLLFEILRHALGHRIK